MSTNRYLATTFPIKGIPHKEMYEALRSKEIPSNSYDLFDNKLLIIDDKSLTMTKEVKAVDTKQHGRPFLSFFCCQPVQQVESRTLIIYTLFYNNVPILQNLTHITKKETWGKYKGEPAWTIVDENSRTKLLSKR